MPLTQVTYPGWTLDAAVGASFGTTSSNLALPGTPSGDSLVRLVNVGSWPIWFTLGGSAVVATPATGAVVMPGQELFLVRGSATYIAGIILGGNSGFGLANISTGN
jgi:hypothetical protein